MEDAAVARRLLMIEKELKEIKELLIKSESPEDWELEIIEKREKESEEIDEKEIFGALNVQN